MTQETRIPVQPSLFPIQSSRPKPHDRAAETMATYGPEALTDAQLLGAFLQGAGTTKAQKALDLIGGLKSLFLIGRHHLEELGLSAKEAARMEAIPELLRRMNRADTRPRINSPRAAGEHLLPRATGWTEERFGLLALNAKGDLMGERIISQGTASATLVSPREVFREGLRFGATTILVFHNHPSGDPSPSREDIALTRRLRAAGESLGVPLADHIIIGKGVFHSFRAAEGWDQG